jgi:hypothetical protein
MSYKSKNCASRSFVDTKKERSSPAHPWKFALSFAPGVTSTMAPFGFRA